MSGCEDWLEQDCGFKRKGGGGNERVNGVKKSGRGNGVEKSGGGNGVVRSEELQSEELRSG